MSNKEDFVLVGSKANLRNLTCLIEAIEVRYLVVETDYTFNHFEKLLASCADRGYFKWIAETKKSAYLDGMKDPRAEKAHIDNADLFPRLYFYGDCLLKEFGRWCTIRQQDIQKITVPIDYSPQFDGDLYLKVITEILGD